MTGYRWHINDGTNIPGPDLAGAGGGDEPPMWPTPAGGPPR